MESTGCYWKLVLNILEVDPEYRFAVVLANAQQVKAVTGHKTDPQDARWLAHLLRHGMIRPSFIPPRAQRELRDLTRRRKQMVRAAADERNRVQKVLEDANVKIGDVLSDVFGLSGQLMLEALVAGKSSVVDVAHLARGHARKKIADLTAALEGHQMRDSHRFLIHAAPGLPGRGDRSAGSGNRQKYRHAQPEPAVSAVAKHSRHWSPGRGRDAGRGWPGHETV